MIGRKELSALARKTQRHNDLFTQLQRYTRQAEIQAARARELAANLSALHDDLRREHAALQQHLGLRRLYVQRAWNYRAAIRVLRRTNFVLSKGQRREEALRRMEIRYARFVPNVADFKAAALEAAGPVEAAASCGIYFLIANQDIVYVGQSRDVQSRVLSHAQDSVKDFDRWCYLEVPADHLDRVERFFIDLLLPTFNKDATTKALRKSGRTPTLREAANGRLFGPGHG